MIKVSWGLLLGLIFLVVRTTEGRTKSPLIDEDITKTRNKAAECVFGKQVKELGSQWIPDLGVPIGVLYCMKCECVPMQKKRRIVARVQCRNVKSECPVTTCENATQPIGRCCKTCPGDENQPDVIQDIVPQNVLDEEEKNSKHYAALLTGRSGFVFKNDYGIHAAPHDPHKNNVVATGRFTFHKKNLHYSFYISDKAARPRNLQFIDNDGNILEEFSLSRPGGLVNSYYQNSTGKVCGIWRRLPRDYRRLLKQERMFAVLVWGSKDQDFSLSGQIMRYVALGTELFSSLLEPAPGTNALAMEGAGGTAIVSISTSVSTSIHLAIIFNGLFTMKEIFNVPINVTLSVDERRFILQETIRVPKPQHELNLIEISSPVTSADLRLLTRGRLLLTVSSVSKPDAMRLSGNVVTKATCELFQAVLTSNPSDYNANPYGTSGLAWLYLNNEGSLVYNVQIDSLKPEQMPSFITLVDVSTKRKTELEDLTPYFVNGWANGTVDKLSPKVLEPLYSGNLAVNVATQSESSLIKGKLIGKAVADARDAPAPYLLKREDYSLPASAVGLAWLAVDNECHIHYDVQISGLGSNPGERKLELYIELLPMLAPGAPNITRYLDEFFSNQVEGSPVSSLTKEELVRLDTGVGILKVKDKYSRSTLLAATIRHVIVPSSCKPSYTDNNVPNVPFEVYDQGDNDPQPSGDCFYEGKFYQEETQWTTSADACTMCFCQNGNAKCDTMTCPEISCANGFKVIAPGECCPVCSNASSDDDRNNASPKCILNGKTYSPGSRFHPFLIPNGFDTCAECTCDPLYLEIKCTRNPNEKNCCKNCQKNDDSMNGTYHADDESVPIYYAGMMPKKEIPTKTPQQILAEGGCKNLYNQKKPYENGSEYHPSLGSLGDYKCVTCKCQNGNQSCRREQCDLTTCEKMFKMRRRRGPNATSDFCCSFKECRRYRHRKSQQGQSLMTQKS